MDIEKRVATLEQSRKLKELGVEINSHMVWYELSIKTPVKQWGIIERWLAERNSEVMIPAPTAEEIAELLPDEILDDDIPYQILTYKRKGIYHVNCNNSFFDIQLYLSREKSLTHALASMLIWLIENNHIKA